MSFLPTLDCFASHLNAVYPDFYSLLPCPASLGVDFFAQPLLPGCSLFLCPPVCQIACVFSSPDEFSAYFFSSRCPRLVQRRLLGSVASGWSSSPPSLSYHAICAPFFLHCSFLLLFVHIRCLCAHDCLIVYRVTTRISYFKYSESV